MALALTIVGCVLFTALVVGLGVHFQDRVFKPGSTGPNGGGPVLRGRGGKVGLNAKWKRHYWVPYYDEEGNPIPRQRRIELQQAFRDAAREGRPAPDTRSA